jgi:cell division septation protein DedD
VHWRPFAVKSLGFHAPRTSIAEKRLGAARQHPESLPASFELRAFERDVALMKALERCRDAAGRVYDEVQDTLNQIGTRGSRSAAEAYAYMKAAFHAAPSLKRTVGDLSTRRPQGTNKEATPVPQAAAPTTPATPPAPTPAPANQVTPAPDKKAA